MLTESTLTRVCVREDTKDDSVRRVGTLVYDPIALSFYSAAIVLVSPINK